MKSDTIEQDTRDEHISTILKIMTMLKKALERKARKTYLSPTQYPQVYHELLSALNALHLWVQTYSNFSGTSSFHWAILSSLEAIHELVLHFFQTAEPIKGAKQSGKAQRAKEHERLERSIRDMLDRLKEYAEELKPVETELALEIEKVVLEAFDAHCQREHEAYFKLNLSKRGGKTIIFPSASPSDYLDIVADSKRFQREVVEVIRQNCNVEGHKTGCKAGQGYSSKGFRSSPRKVIMEGGEKQTFPIRMVVCKECGQRFSVLPSFLPREKHFGINIIGNILRGILLSANSLSSAMENSKLTGYALKSRQTLLNWIAWIGFHHPATLMTRSGIKGTGYFQEDEAFEKEPELRTYTVAMVDSATMVVWHLDYVDRVDEETLCASFKSFLDKIDFKVLGVTKDKWRASTNAIKDVFYRIWIGFCHRHCLKKFREALNDYQKDHKCDDKEVKRIFEVFKKILDTANSKVNLEVKLSLCKEAAFEHPSVRPVIEEVVKNAVHYTANQQRKGIKKTTSLVDNFLKTVKRKLNQVESFRDPNWTALMFRAMANVRNFAPFWPGAKNAKKSPFMLAGGETHDLDWIQTMNVHNAFLF